MKNNLPRKSFFSRQSLFLVVIGALVLYLIFAGVTIGVKRVAYERHKAAERAAQQRFNALSPAEKAIRRAEARQAIVIKASSPLHRLLFDYLQRAYNLRSELSVASSPLQIPIKQTQQSVELQYLARIAFPDKAFTEPPVVPVEGVSLTNIYASHCDKIALPADYWTLMRSQYEQGGYYLTHVALAFRFMKDNNCDIPDDAKVLESQVNRGMVAIAADPASLADLRYEAIALLLLSGSRSDVKQEWINQIASEQLPDGSWALQLGGTSNDHTTLLAMWALLQYSRPDVEYQPLIRHPAN